LSALTTADGILTLETAPAAAPRADAVPARVPAIGADLYVSVGLLAGAVIALQIAIMRVFSVGSWAHFGSLVVSLALLGFGLSSVVVFVGRAWFERHWIGTASVALLLFGPLAVASNLVAQTVPFNAIFLISDPAQIWRLSANFVLYLLPFLAGAMFLGVVFLRSRAGFGRVYFADLTGSGIAGLVILAAMYVVPPEQLIAVPLLLWTVAAIAWFGGRKSTAMSVVALLLGVGSTAAYLWLPGVLGVPDIAVSQYKGVAYARNFPDASRIYRSISPFGDLQIYASSYMHFSPGLSDNAAFNLPELPGKSFVAMYIDGEGPEGIMHEPPAEDASYFRYLPMYFPYVVKQAPKTFVVQFGGGISTMVALHAGSSAVTVAESNPAVLAAYDNPVIADASSNVLHDPRVSVVDYEGRLYLKHTTNRYDVIDLSLADSVGLSNPGGFAIAEKYPYTAEAMADYMRALADGGILSVTVWNKEEPPKSILKLYSTIAQAAKAVDPAGAANSIFVASSYLSTSTVLYRKGGFTADELDKLRQYTSAMSWDEIYSPGFAVDATQGPTILAQYEGSIFGNGDTTDASTPSASVDPSADTTDNTDTTGPADNTDPTGPADNTDTTNATTDGSAPVPATTLGRLFWHWLLTDDAASIGRYVFDAKPLTNARPYFAAYEWPGDLLRTLDRLDLFQDDWGYLLLWATLGVAAACAAVLIVLPVLFGWRSVFARAPGKLGTIGYFAALGLGYITVEVGLISRFTLALSNPTISASVLISAMLVFSGIGSLLSERIFARARGVLPVILIAVVVLLVGYALLLDPVLDWIGAFPFGLRLLFCFVLVAPPALLMGFPMSTAMNALTRLGKDHMFVWAWGINGCFSVIGAAAVPLIATTFGLPAVLEVSAAAYLLAIPAFLAVLRRPQAAA
jgi:spermidine synthase